MFRAPSSMSLCMWERILRTTPVSYFLQFTCFTSYVNINFLHTCNLTLHGFPFLSFQVRYHLEMDVFNLSCNSTCFEHNFWLTCSLLAWVFPVKFYSNCVKLNLAVFWSLRWIYYVSVAILRLLIKFCAALQFKTRCMPCMYVFLYTLFNAGQKISS